jgi:hypothetical protein
MSSALAAAQKAIYVRFETQWGDRCPVAYPNAPFTPPTDPKAPWASLVILWGDAFPQTQGVAGEGRGRNSSVGIVQIDLYVPKDEARERLMANADAARDIFNRADFNGVRCDAPSAPKPVAGDDEWDRLIVSVPFSVDELV